MAEMPSRAEIEAALFLHRERTDLGVAHTTPEGTTLAQVAKAWLAALDGPTVTFDEEGTYGMTDYAEVVFDGETEYVLVKKEDR